MNVVFADASYWIAQLSPRDQLHAAAVGASKLLAGKKILTTQMVLVEVLNALASGEGSLRKAVLQSIDDIQKDPDVEVVKQSAEQFQSALNVFRQYDDKQWSLTDCASFAAMKNANATEALTHDHHFEEMGFTALLRAH